MRGIPPRRHALRYAAVVAGLALLALLVPVSAAGAATPTSPAPQATSTTAPGLNIGLNLLGIKLHLDVPLTLGGLLGLGSTTTTTPPVTAPPTSTPPTSAPPSSHASTGSAHSRTQPAHGTGGGQQVVAAVRSSASHPSAHRTPSTSIHIAHAPRTQPPAAGGGFVLTRPLSNSGIALLIAVLVATAIAVAIVVRIAGRRGSHRV